METIGKELNRGMKKINVDLYGGKPIFGGRETPLEADIIYCDRSDKCSFYKSNKCLKVRAFLHPTCKFGKREIIKGYTKRANKYYDFKKKYEQDECYNQLKYPTALVGLIDDIVYMNLKYTLVNKKREEKTYSRFYNCVDGYEITEVGFCSGECFIPLTDLTFELFNAILSYQPYSMMGGIIIDYQDKVVPEIIQEFRKILPNYYAEFIKQYPKYDITPNYIGKKAYINSLKPNIKFYYEGYMWTYDGEYVSTNNFDIHYKSPWCMQGSKNTDVKFKVNDKMTIEITDNSIVDENTKFDE